MSLSILLSGAIFMGIFNLLLFVIGDSSTFTKAVWISYGFIHFAFVVSFITPLITSGRKDFARQSSISYIFTGAYFVLAFIVGLIFIIVAPESSGAIKASWIIQVILFALFLISFLPVLLTNSHTNKMLSKQGRAAMFLQDASSRVKLLRDSATDNKIVAELDLLASTISASPIKSSSNVKELETQMMMQISELEEAIDEGDAEKAIDMCKKITRGVKERNRILRLVSHK